LKKINKLIAVVGPTASGKSDLAVDIATEFNGEVISADSRQVYKGLDIGTGKITLDEMKGVRHYLLDVADPEKVFSVTDYKKLANEAVQKIKNSGKLPILCGGTGLYIKSIIDDISFPNVPPNKELRDRLSEKNVKELYQELVLLDPARAENIDPQNPRRLIRAIEIAKALGSVPPITQTGKNAYDTLQIGIRINTETLRENIRKRLLRRIEEGMIEEAIELHKNGLSYERMEALGLEYRYMARFLGGNLTKQEMIVSLEKEIWSYAKRQKTWFKKDERIKWYKLDQKTEILEQVKQFLSKK
jgi:tRNA dimethylallyltransferase